MGNQLDGKIAAVTGGGSGIGAAICRRFAAEGARVAVLDVNVDAAEAIASQIGIDGGRARAFACNVSNQAEVKTSLINAAGAFGGLTTLVNNAGIAHIGNVEQTTSEDFDRIYEVNVKGVFYCLQSGIELLKKNRGGSIINIASVAATVGIPDRFAYSMSKGAVLMMTRSVACDYVQENIRCNSISPARVHTPFVDDFLKQSFPGREREVFEQLAATQPVGRMGEPEEIASLAVFLASDESAFVTGANYEIDGGFQNLKP